MSNEGYVAWDVGASYHVWRRMTWFARVQNIADVDLHGVARLSRVATTVRNQHQGRVLSSPRAAISWSGGKDCCTALLRTHRSFDVTAAITMFAEGGERSRSHGLRPEVIAAQIGRLGLESLTAECSWETYTHEYERVLARAAAKGISHVIFGDVMCEAHRAWNERVCARHALVPVLPLWGQSTAGLAAEFIATGSAAIIVTARASHLDASWLGRTLTSDAVRELEALDVDPCGEHGEFHTLVTSTPLFSTPLDVALGVRVMRQGCWALDVTVADEAASRAQTMAATVLVSQKTRGITGPRGAKRTTCWDGDAPGSAPRPLG